MSGIAHDWESKLAEGTAGEDIVISALKKLGTVDRATSMELQRAGIDCFVNNETLGVLSLEIKTCSQVAKTGNVFLEYEVEYSDQKRLGWVLKTVAQRVVYYSPQQRKAYLMDSVALKRNLAQWKLTYPLGKAVSRGNGNEWIGIGVVVPLSVVYEATGTGAVTI